MNMALARTIFANHYSHMAHGPLPHKEDRMHVEHHTQPFEGMAPDRRSRQMVRYVGRENIEMLEWRHT